MKKLQIAFDDNKLEECIEIGNMVYDYIDIIEFGTPMVYKYGAEGVKELKKHFPNKKVLADFKIMDGGALETQIALEAGADIVTVLALADNITIEDSLKEVKKENKELLVDLIGVEDLEARVNYLDNLGVDYICVHTGVDVQKTGESPLDTLKKVKQMVKNTKISVAGGININTAEDISKAGADIVIVGSGLVKAENPLHTAKQIRELVK